MNVAAFLSLTRKKCNPIHDLYRIALQGMELNVDVTIFSLRKLNWMNLAQCNIATFTFSHPSYFCLAEKRKLVCGAESKYKTNVFIALAL